MFFVIQTSISLPSANSPNYKLLILFGTRVEHLNLYKNDVKFSITGAGFESRFWRDYAKRSTPEEHKPADLARILPIETKKQVMVGF